MREGVIGGICLLAFLLSVGQAEDLDDSKKLGESDISAQKETEVVITNEGRNANNDMKSSNIASDDLNRTDLTVATNESNAQAEGIKPSIEIQNAHSINADVLSQHGSDTMQLKEAASHETVTQQLPSFRSNSTVTDSDKSLLVNQTGSTLTSQSPVGSVPRTTYLTTNTQSPKNPVLLVNEGKETESKNPYYVGLNVLPPLYASHVAAETSSKAPDESRFSPLFSSDNSHAAPLGSFISSSFRTGSTSSPTLPAFSDIPQPTFEYSRRESKKDEIQERNADESQYSETMNSYPYTPPSGKSDSASNESNELRSGVPYGPNYPPYSNPQLSSAQAYAAAQVQSNIDNLSAKNQGLDPYSFGYPPGLVSNAANTASATALAQLSSGGAASAQSSAFVIEDAKSRIIWPNELIFPNKIPGGENVIHCGKENELYHFWSLNFDCLVCICLNVYGVVEPICASCSGCQQPALSEPPLGAGEPPLPPDSFAPIPLPDPYVPLPLPNLEPNPPSASAPSLVVEPIGEADVGTTPPPVREVSATCSPLPSGQLFTNPLHPCQLCICKEIVDALGKTEFRIDCQENHDCVLPPDVTPIPPLPDVVVPVPLPACEKFPPHVSFPHPTESCKTCKCSLELSAVGLPEQQITCSRDIACVSNVEPTPAPVTPPAPPIPIPVEPYTGPVPEPTVEPVPENYPSPVPPPNTVTPEEPLPWPPISTPAPPLIPLLPKRGPLPGPSPHDSCRPYPPNQPFQHPWDDCQVCQCSETRATGVVNVEISCYTKLSCCIESPEQVISEASTAGTGEDSQASATALFQGPLSSTSKTPYGTYIPGGSQSQGYAEANAITQNVGPYGVGGGQTQGYAEANALAQNSGTLSSGSSLTQANALAQNSGGQSQGYAAANAIAQNSGTYIPGSSQNLGYAEANAIAQNSINSPSNQLYGPYQSTNAISNAIVGNQLAAEATAETSNLGPFTSYNAGVPQNQGYAEANTIVQNSLNNPAYPGLYQSANAYGNAVNNGGQTSAEASAEFNNLAGSSSPYNPAVGQNQAYAEANAVAQNNLAYQMPGPFQPAKGISNINSGEGSDEYTVTYKPPPSYAQYNPGISQSQAYTDASAQYNRPVSTAKPPTLYNPYNTDINQNKAYAEAMAQYSDLMTNTQKPPFYGQYNPGISQNQAYAQANSQYNNLITTTYKPPVLYNPYKSDISQSQVYPQPNALYTITSTVRPATLYGQYNPGVSQNQAYAAANTLYTGSGTDKPQLYNPYNPGGSKNKAYSEASAIAQNSHNNPGYYGAGQYQSAAALGSVSGDQSSAVAEAIAQSQDFSPYYQPGSQVGKNPISSPSYGYPYQSNYYGYQNPQYSSYGGKSDLGVNGQYKTSPVKYAGNYEFNGQADSISVLNPQNGYYPYTSGYSQGIAASKLYPSLYPKQNSYDIYRNGQYSPSGQSAAQAYAGSVISQSKSGEGYPEDSSDSK